MPKIELFGLLSSYEEKAGFQLMLDDDYYVLLLRKGDVIATFDPRDYTATELRQEAASLIQQSRAQ